MKISRLVKVIILNISIVKENGTSIHSRVWVPNVYGSSFERRSLVKNNIINSILQNYRDKSFTVIINCIKWLHCQKRQKETHHQYYHITTSFVRVILNLILFHQSKSPGDITSIFKNFYHTNPSYISDSIRLYWCKFEFFYDMTRTIVPQIFVSASWLDYR